MRLITGGVLIRWCSLLGAPEAERVLHPVRLHRETINHQNGSETEEKERERGQQDRRDAGRGERKNMMRRGERGKRDCALAETNIKLFRCKNTYENPMSLVRVEATLHCECGSQGHVRAHNN